MNMSEFLATADSRQTSKEIMEAIWGLSWGSLERAERIWEDPTCEEYINIWEAVTNNGLRDATDYDWGASGDQWKDILDANFSAEDE